MAVITLCGSTKFKPQFREAEAVLTLQGHIVLSVGFFEQSDGIEITEAQERMLKENCIFTKSICQRRSL